ncbi:MAG: ABC transporter permease [Bacteroidales bacterium]|jgi:ABC-type antimicrobial peptide transport system permease subunit|nr:ABC transporter permease [Bacteroidales bacterium]
MIKNFFKLAFRNILSNKSTSFLNIFGLSIGLAAALFILMWIQHELSYDKFFDDADQIYRVEEDQHYSGNVYHVNVTPYPSGAEWKKRIPEIIEYTRFSYLPRVLFENDGMKMFEDNLRGVDSTFFRMFSFRFKYGDPQTALSDPHTIVLTEELAEKYFGDENPLGKSITIEKQFSFMVTGVLEEMPDNTVVSFDAVIPFRFLDQIGITNDHWGSNSITTYVKCVPDFDREALGEKMTSIQREYAPESLTEFMVADLTRIHLHSYFGYERSPGAIVNIYIFGAIGLFVLIIACINFINLTTARSSLRGKEIGVKKVVGARKGSMVVQFMLESVFQVLIALVIAFIIIGLLLQPFNTVSGKEFDLADMFSAGFILGSLLVAVVAGIVAGIYPAFFLSSFKAVNILKGEVTKGKKSGSLRRILVITQVVLSVFLAVSGIVIYSQLQHMRNIDMGYDKENLIYIPVTENFESKYNAVKGEFERNPLIENISASSLNPVYIGSNSSGVDWEGKDPDLDVLFSYNHVDYGLIETMKYEIVDGRPFSRDYPGDMPADTMANFIVNEELVRIMGVDDPVGRWFRFQGYRGEIVGVLKDFHFQTARSKIEPLAINLEHPESFNYIMIRLSDANPQGAIEAVRDIWDRTITDYPLTFEYVDDVINDMYRSELRMSRLFKYFTILATLIAALGLYGLSSFIAERRTREIGIRKIMGSSVSRVVVLLSTEFLYLVLIAAVVGFPLSYLYLNNWLKDFPYRIDIGAGVFLIVGFGAFLISLLTVSFQSYRAAVINPANAIKRE